MRHFYHALTVTIAFFAGISISPQQSQSASHEALTSSKDLKVSRVKDGDSLLIPVDNGFEIEVRLIEIDAPERHQAYGKDATEKLKELCLGKSVTVQGRKKDKYGRVLAHVYCDDIHVNSHLVENGLAWVYEKYSNNPELLKLQNEAQSNCRGLWQHTAPQAPSDYRAHGKNKAQDKTVTINTNHTNNCVTNIAMQK